MRQDYQTVFADHEGAVAAPTAGLHFTPELLAALTERGIAPRHHHAACRRRHVPAGALRRRCATSDACRARRDHARRPLLRSMRRAAQAAALSRSAPPACVCWKAPLPRTAQSIRSPATPTLFILPGYRFRAVDLLLTNFHLPRSTLFMLVCAFAGHRAHAQRLRSCDRTRAIGSIRTAMRLCWSAMMALIIGPTAAAHLTSLPPLAAGCGEC